MIHCNEPKDVTCCKCGRSGSPTESFYGPNMWIAHDWCCGHAVTYECPECSRRARPDNNHAKCPQCGRGDEHT